MLRQSEWRGIRVNKIAQHHSKTVEHYTPSLYIEPYRRMVGQIDLDPASCALANTVVQARYFYALPQDGLLLPWSRHVWNNPPYGWRDKPNGVSNKELWLRRAILAYESSEIIDATLLLTASTGDPWFRLMWGFPVCFPDHRVAFWGPSAKNSNPGSNALVYLGDRVDEWSEAYEPIGRVVPPNARYRDPDNEAKYHALLARCGDSLVRGERKQLSIFG